MLSANCLIQFSHPELPRNTEFPAILNLEMTTIKSLITKYLYLRMKIPTAPLVKPNEH